MNIDTPEGSRTEGAASAELTERVFIERISLYYESLFTASIAVTINIALVAFLFWQEDFQKQVIGWCVFSLIIVAYRSWILVAYRKQTPGQREERKAYWYRQALLGACLGGSIWGVMGFFLYDPSSMLRQSIVPFLVAGMCAGSIISSAAFAEASILFLVVALSPLITRLVGIGNADAGVMATVAFAYLVFLSVFARQINRTVVEGLEMKLLRSRAEETIQRQALFDELTGLPNRRLLQDRLSQALARAKRQKSKAALMFLDVDFFKRVNDSLGHSVGDELLVEIANRMRALLRDEDTAARLGGDEFVALLTDLSGEGDSLIALVRRRGEELRRSIEQPINIRGNEIHVTVSIGVSLLDGDTQNVEDLLKHADTAMYRAKDDGRNTLRFFVSDMQEALARRMRVEQQLRATLDAKEGLQLFLQPQYNEQMKICGAELLLRWRFDGRFIPPDQFIPIAEDCGLIYRLGDWVIEEACRLGASLAKEGVDQDFSVALNVSPQQFRSKNFTDKVLAALRTQDLPVGLIELEVTEGLLIADVEDTVSKMQVLRAHGVRFSIDDFGTGYSSLSYLKSLPLDTLKIDQSFVRDVLSDPGDASIVRAIVSMAHTLELEVIAEGVETQAVHEFLVAAGCRKFQGFLYSRPMPFDDFAKLLRSDDALSPTGT